MAIAISLFILASLLYFATHISSWKSFWKEVFLFILIVSISSIALFGKSFNDKYFAKDIVQASSLQQSDVIDTEAPKIQITYPQDGAVFPANQESIIVQVEVWDAIDPSPTVQGDGIFYLQPGFNSIIVTSSDASGNVGSSYVVVEKKE